MTRRERGNAQPNKIWQGTLRRGGLPIRETIMRHARPHPSKPNRGNADRGQGQKKPMAALDEETLKGIIDLSQGRVEKITDRPSKNAGIAKTQYMEWQKAGVRDAREYKRWRIHFQRIKTRAGESEQRYQEIWEKVMCENAAPTKKENAPERTKRGNNGKLGRKNKRKNAQGEQCAKQKREQDQKTLTGKGNRKNKNLKTSGDEKKRAKRKNRT